MQVLNSCYDRLHQELIKMFDEYPKAVKCFQGEFFYSGRNWYSGEYWRVTLPQSIRYADSIYLSQERDKQLKKETEPFAPDKKSFFVLFQYLKKMPGRIIGDDDILDKTTLFETAIKIYWFSQFRNKEGFSQRKQYIKLRNEMIEKLRATYSQMTDTKVFNLFKIYLLFNENPRTKCCKIEFLFSDKIELNKICWMGPYLQKASFVNINIVNRIFFYF